MRRVLGALRGVMANFGPMVAFLVASRLFSVKVAIALSMLWTLGEIVYLRVRRERPTRIFWFTAAMTLAFGALDLYQREPTFLRWEAVITNVITGLYFGATVLRGKSLIQEFYEKSQNVTELPRPELADFFRAFTALWALYFFAKALVYAWIAQRYPLDRAMALRAVIGSTSFYAMMALSAAGRPLFMFAKRMGLFPDRPKPVAEPAPATVQGGPSAP